MAGIYGEGFDAVSPRYSTVHGGSQAKVRLASDVVLKRTEAHLPCRYDLHYYMIYILICWLCSLHFIQI